MNEPVKKSMSDIYDYEIRYLLWSTHGITSIERENEGTYSISV